MAINIDLNERELLKQNEKHEEMMEYLRTVNPLRSGTKAMRAQGQRLLPAHSGEDVVTSAGETSRYHKRLSRSFLFPAYADTLERHVSRPFSQEVIVSDTKHDRLEGIKKDAGMDCESITNLAKSLFINAEHAGMVHVLIDMPAGQAEGDTEADARKANRRPIFREILADQLYFWKEEIVNGAMGLQEIRIRVSESEVLVYQMVDGVAEFATVRKDEGVWVMGESSSARFNRIPLESAYFSRVRYMQSKPAMWNLAEQNVKYWQQQSDQDSILLFARTGTYFVKGFEKSEMNFSIGANQVVAASNTSADFKVVEYSGSSVKIGQDALDKLQGQMEITGLKPELQNSADSTATAALINSSAANSDIKVWATVIEDLLERCYRVGAERIGTTLPEDFAVTVYKDFDLSGSKGDMPIITQMQLQGIITRSTVINEAKRRSILSSRIDTDKELTDMDEEDFSTLKNMGSI